MNILYFNGNMTKILEPNHCSGIPYITIKPESAFKTLTIEPTPSDATVALTADGFEQVNNSITVEEGTSVNYSVSKENYKENKGDVVVNEDKTLSITLEKNE